MTSEKSLSYIMCQLSALTYKSRIPFPVFGFDTVQCIEKDNACVHIFENSTIMVLAFRGTNDIADFFADINMTSQYTNNGTVHYGFYKEYRKLEPLFRDKLTNTQKHIYCTGHSLGGALAVIASSEYPVKAVVTFGAPKVGASDFCKSCSNVVHIRWVNGGDKIARLPISRFSHFGEERRLKFKWYRRFTERTPHLILNYLKGIQKLGNDLNNLPFEKDFIS